MHTNLDQGDGGVNDALCDVIGLKNVETVETPDKFLIKKGEISPLSADDFAKHLKKVLSYAFKDINTLTKIQNTFSEFDRKVNKLYELDSKIEEVANGLGLGDIGLDRDVTDLSGGQRSKVLLVKLLLENPSILILDEPTNYLDHNHIVWLQRYLQEYENAFILVSHDVDFLNSVVNVIYNLDGGNLTRYTGDYENFRRMYEIQKEQELRAYERQQAEIEKLEDFIARNKARVATRGMAHSRQRQLDKMEILERPTEKIKPEFNFLMARTPSRFLVEAKDLVIGYDSPLTKPVSFTLERGEKVAIVGTNGLGKSTLLNVIGGLDVPSKGEIVVKGRSSKDFSQSDFDSYRNTYVGFVFQDYHLLNELNKFGKKSIHISDYDEIIDYLYGEGAGYKSVTLLVEGKHAYGNLKSVDCEGRNFVPVNILPKRIVEYINMKYIDYINILSNKKEG